MFLINFARTHVASSLASQSRDPIFGISPEFAALFHLHLQENTASMPITPVPRRPVKTAAHVAPTVNIRRRRTRVNVEPGSLASIASLRLTSVSTRPVRIAASVTIYRFVS